MAQDTSSASSGGFIPPATNGAKDMPPPAPSISDHLHRIEDKTSRIEDKYARSEALLARIENKHARNEELLSRLEGKIEGPADVARQSDLASMRGEMARQSDLAALRGEVRNLRERVGNGPGGGTTFFTALLSAILTVVLLVAVQRLKLDDMAMQKIGPLIGMKPAAPTTPPPAQP